MPESINIAKENTALTIQEAEEEPKFQNFPMPKEPITS
jgi:hypothetical protein